MGFDEFVQLIPKIKNIPLPAETSHFKMIPPTRKALAKQKLERVKNAKKAGVLALFYPDKKRETNIILILRKTYKGVHSAQVSFPGGKFESGDRDLMETAVRETYEEVGVPMQAITVVKKLSEVYIPPSNFYVQPFMGVLQNTPNFKKQDDEVDALIEVKLSDLLSNINLVEQEVQTSYSFGLEVPAFNLNGFTVWGATAMMLSEVKDIVQELT